MMWRKLILISLAAVIGLLFVGGQAVTAEEAVIGNNGADVSRDDFGFQGWVDVGPNSEPFFDGGEGYVVIPIYSPYQAVITPSGNVNLNGKGEVPFGEQMWAIDLVKGEWIIATLATMEEACAAVETVFPDDICRGPNGPFFGSYENFGVYCDHYDDAGNHWATQDWLGVVSKGGRATINCHFGPDDLVVSP